jgi:superfamily II DNA or RNA helicase
VSLNDLDLKFKYRSELDNIYHAFFLPCIDNSSRYDRVMGYFTCNSLKMFSRGLEKFVFEEGKVRLIGILMLTTNELNLLGKSEVSISELTQRNLERVINELSEVSRESLEIIADLLKKDKLEIKIVSTDVDSSFFEEFGLFYDNSYNKILFSGLTYISNCDYRKNFMKINVFTSLHEVNRIEDAMRDFENLWTNNTGEVMIHNFPNDLKEEIIEKFGGMTSIIKHISSKVGISLRDYQEEAVIKLKANDFRGILEMATGTGKTKTSLFASLYFQTLHDKVFLIVFVPYTHLVFQWEQECKDFGYSEVISCFGLKKTWLYKLENAITRFNAGVLKKCAVIVLYKSAIKSEFIENIRLLKSGQFIIADECHYFGMKSMINSSFDTVNARLGLSATPQRWWDKKGTDYVLNYFNKVVYSYSLEEAIQNNYLSKYKYFPILVGLNEDEIENYRELSIKIAGLINSDKLDDIERTKRLLIKRKLIVSKATQKKEKLEKLLMSRDIKNDTHMLVYCAPTEIIEITTMVHEIGYKVSKFDQSIDFEERTKILRDFSNGKIQVLVAIKCLDEGVDVPSTKTAFFLASTSNPREFIQRRGRILRPSINKQYAEIYDFIVVYNSEKQLDVDIAKKELPRFAEFAEQATNKYSARRDLYDLLSEVNLEYLLNKKAWDIYKEENLEKENEHGN